MKMASRLAWALALGLAGFHLYTAAFGVFSPQVQRAAHLMVLLLLALWVHGPGREGDKPPAWRRVWDWFLLALALAAGLYLLPALGPEAILERGIAGPEPWEVGVGVGVMLLILEATRRSLGLPIVLVALGFVAYALAGPWLPLAISHRGYDLERLASYLFWSTEGVFGIPLAVSATFVVIFIIMGSLLDRLGAGEFFLRLTQSLAGRLRGGPAQTAVLASALMGSISGSSVSNVVTTGNFTIPLMIRTGFSPLFAGALEAAASTGGQIMPPVMGAAAFVMAEMLGISYPTVALAATLPALLYFLGVGLMVYFRARRLDMRPLAAGQLPPLGQTLAQGFHLLLPLAVLVYLLVGRGLSPLKAGLGAVLSLLVVAGGAGLIRERAWPWRQMLEGLTRGVFTAMPVALACACAGIIIGVTSLTGLGVRLTQLVVQLAGGQLWLAGLLTMLACLLLGTGLPTTAAYIITAVLGAPALQALGVPALAAHMFIFYFAIISFITPPVAISAFAASGIAGANPLLTGLMACRLGLAGFLVPFAFLYRPSLLLVGSPGRVLLDGLAALAGMALLAGALEGWLVRPLNWWQRLALACMAISLIIPFA